MQFHIQLPHQQSQVPPIPNRHHEFVHQASGVPVGYWNAVGSGYTIFAVESFVDEVAAKLGKDPLQLRIDLLTDTRGKAVLDTRGLWPDQG